MSKYVLAEYLKEQLNGRRINAAVFHTFNFDSEFFENYLLPLFLPDIPFGDNKIQNTILWKKFQHDLPPITVYCDFHAKAQKGIHLNYLVRPIDVQKLDGFKPCYHPKHSFILLEGNELLIITGSNNLTEAGWCSNLEGINFFKLKNKVNFPQQFKDKFKFFNRDIRKTYFNENFQDNDSISIADNLIDRFFRSQGYTDETKTMYFDTRLKPEKYLQNFKSFIEYIKIHLNESEPFEKVEVISPYFSKEMSIFNKLREVTKCDDISLSIPFENTDVVALDKALFEEVKSKGFHWKSITALKETKGYRFNHAKIYQFVGRESVFTVVGSVNFTNMAWKGVKNGGNYESAILHVNPKEDFKSLLESCSLENLTFTGHREEENISDLREDSFKLNFVLDWSLQTLEIQNDDEFNQKGKIEFKNSSSIQINISKTVKLSEEQIRSLSNNPILKVKPSGKDYYFYYYPIHKNIEAKPLPEHLNLNDAELLQLWLDLDTTKNNATTLRIIDSFIDRITDEAGDIKDDELKSTNSTLNVMATHLSGLIKLQKRLFKTDKTISEKNSTIKLKDYYLFTNNVDTISGYRNLIAKMYNDGKLNGGFYWLLLNIIDLFFYKSLNDLDFENNLDYIKLQDIRKHLKSDIKKIKEEIVEGNLTEKHLKWTLKMLWDDIK
ncbi:phospholipase D-like domain-containing protein [Polaribacter atrinae]|uniref:phospholipase D-like domain-containing protein n=1 Tax=Polaribacter atrinae TaxID=1333662 RepID=UPI0030F6BA00